MFLCTMLVSCPMLPLANQDYLLMCAVSPWLGDKPKNAMILEAPWLLHAPKLLLWYVFAAAALYASHDPCSIVSSDSGVQHHTIFSMGLCTFMTGWQKSMHGHIQQHDGAVLCCAVLCCAVLCCAVLCCAVLCCAVLCYHGFICSFK